MKTLERLPLPALLLLAFALPACAGAALTPTAPPPTTTADGEKASSPSPLPTPTQLLPSTRTATPTPAPTSRPSPTPLPLSPSTPARVGTPVPSLTEPIRADNLRRLAHAATWGRGTIRGVAFSPDGESFVAGSAFGLATYDLQTLEDPPRWTPFHPPYAYETLSFSEDGAYVRLIGRGKNNVQVRRYAGGEVVAEPPEGARWLAAPSLFGARGPRASSPDGALEVTSRVEYKPPDELECIREVWDARSGELLYRLPDETIMVRYEDRHEPEGCDLSSFSLCAHTYEPLASLPYRASFPPRGRAWRSSTSHRS